MKKKASRPRTRSGSSLWQALRSPLKKELSARLGARLKHANTAGVVALAMAQLKHRELDGATKEAGPEPSVEAVAERGAWLRRFAAEWARSVSEEEFIEECERSAEYGAEGTSAERQVEIRREFLEKLRDRIGDWVRAMLEDRGRWSSGEAAEDEVAGKVMDVLFSRDAFRKLTSAHRPEKGMTFRRFLEKKAFWMCQDAVAKFAEGQPYVVSLEGLIGLADPGLGPDVLSGEVAGVEVEREPGEEGLPGWEGGDTGGEGDEPATGTEPSGGEPGECARGFSLSDLLEWVDEQAIGERPKALVYLYYKAYVEPEIVPEFVVALLIDGIERLQEDYADTQQALEVLRGEFQAAATDLAAKESRATARYETLRRRFRPSAEELADLEAMARRSTLTELEEEMAMVDPVREEKWVCQLEYMMALRRRDLAQRAYEKAGMELAPYRGVRKPWVRSQKELGDLLGVPVGTLGRELAEVRKVLRDYPLGKFLSEDFGAGE